MPEQVSEFGKMWDVRVPRSDVKWLMGRVHVSTSDTEIEADIRKRCTAPGYTAELIEQTVAYALECHRDNQGLYDRVMRGRL